VPDEVAHGDGLFSRIRLRISLLRGEGEDVTAIATTGVVVAGRPSEEGPLGWYEELLGVGVADATTCFGKRAKKAH
jgi:hypothetical protein